MSLGAATAQIIFDMCRDHRKALAEEAWDAIGPINTGYLEMMEPPASFEPILIKPHPIAQVSFSEMDDEQRQLAEMAEDAEFVDDLTDKLEKLEDNGGWTKAEEGIQRRVPPAPGLSTMESKKDNPS